MATDAPDRSIAELLRDLSNETATLVRQELLLARAELVEKAKPAGMSAGLFGGGAVFGLGAFGAITAAVIAAIALALPVWAAALIVAVAYGLVAFVLAQRGKAALKNVAPPIIPQTTTSVKEDVEWAKSHLKSDAR